MGRRLAEAATRDRRILQRVLFVLPAANTHGQHEEVARAVAEAVLVHGKGRRVELVYPRTERDELVHVVLLAGAREARTDSPETYSPIGVVLDHAVREALTGRLAVGAIEALRAEIVARIAAAEKATRACDRKLEELDRKWRAARQERITNELLEVAAGHQVALASPRS